MKRFAVVMTQDAAADLAEIDGYIFRHDSPSQADYVLEKIGEVVNSLSEFPYRGPLVTELAELGEEDCRELFFKPYRVVYWVSDEKVVILAVVDGRRELGPLLTRRLMAKDAWLPEKG